MALRRADNSSKTNRTKETEQKVAKDAQASDVQASTTAKGVPTLKEAVLEKGGNQREAAAAFSSVPGLAKANAGFQDSPRHGVLMLDGVKAEVSRAVKTAQVEVAAQVLDASALEQEFGGQSVEAEQSFAAGFEDLALGGQSLERNELSSATQGLSRSAEHFGASGRTLAEKSPPLANKVSGLSADVKATNQKLSSEVTRAFDHSLSKDNLAKLGPGDKIALNLGFAVGAGVKVGANGKVEIEAFTKPDQTLGYKVVVEQGISVKADAQASGFGVAAAAGATAVFSFEADSPAEAAELAVRAIAANTPVGFAAQAIEGAVTGEVGGLVEKLKSVTIKGVVSASEATDFGFGEQQATVKVEKAMTINFKDGAAVSAESVLRMEGEGQLAVGQKLKKTQVGTPITTAAAGKVALQIKRTIPLPDGIDPMSLLQDAPDLLTSLPRSDVGKVEMQLEVEARAAGAGVKVNITAGGDVADLDLGAIMLDTLQGKEPILPPSWKVEGTAVPFAYVNVGGELDLVVVEASLSGEAVDVDDQAAVKLTQKQAFARLKKGI